MYEPDLTERDPTVRDLRPDVEHVNAIFSNTKLVECVLVVLIEVVSKE